MMRHYAMNRLFTDQILVDTARVMSGYDFPYAALMYIWENNAPLR